MQNNFCLQRRKQNNSGQNTAQTTASFSMYKQHQISTPTQQLQPIKQGMTISLTKSSDQKIRLNKQLSIFFSRFAGSFLGTKNFQLRILWIQYYLQINFQFKIRQMKMQIFLNIGKAMQWQTLATLIQP